MEELMKEFKLKQVATSVPPENVKEDYGITEFCDVEDDILFVHTPECWIRINLTDKTFAVGDYEG